MSLFVSVIVPVYNVRNLIARCAKSLFEQTLSDRVEFIFVNDCSPDDSIEILKKVIEEYPARKPYVHILSHSANQGLAAARNTGMEYASGKYVFHVDSDDYIEKDALDLLFHSAEEEKSDIVFSDILLLRKNHSEVYKYKELADNIQYTKSILFRETGPFLVGKMIARKIYTQNNIHEYKGLNYGEDYSVLPKLCYFAKRIAIIPKPLYVYDMRNSLSYMNNFSQANLDNLLQLTDIYRTFFEQHPIDNAEELLKKMESRNALIILKIFSISQNKRNADLKMKVSEALRKINISFCCLSYIDKFFFLCYHILPFSMTLSALSFFKRLKDFTNKIKTLFSC